MSSRDDLRRLLLPHGGGGGDGGESDDDIAVAHRVEDEERRYGTFGGHKRSSSLGSGNVFGAGGTSSGATGGRSFAEDPESGFSSSSSSVATLTTVLRPPPSRTAKTRQALSSLGYCVGAFAMGNALGWSSPSLPRLESPESSPQLTQAQAGWVGSLVCLGALLQGPSSGFLMTRLGQRWTVFLESLLCIVGWLLIYNAADVWMIYAGRLVTGWAAGAFSVVVPIYVGEIAAPEIRGALGTLFQAMVVAGILTMYAAGASVSWQTLALLGACAPAALACAALFALRDSPASYMSRGRPELARKCLVWLRNTAEVGDELYAAQRAAEDARRGAARGLRVTNVLCAADAAVRRSSALAVFLMCAQQLSGVNAVIVFTVDIFRAAGASSVDPSVATIVVGSVQLIATCLSSALNNRCGRRPVLIVTECIMSVALVAFGGYSYLQLHKPEAAEAAAWLPLVAMAAFILAFSFGLGPLAWLMLGELLPSRAAGAAGALASVVNWSLAFLVTVCFNGMTSAMGNHGAYWTFAGFCAASALVTYRFLPETRGKTLREVQEHFARHA